MFPNEVIFVTQKQTEVCAQKLTSHSLNCNLSCLKFLEMIFPNACNGRMFPLQLLELGNYNVKINIIVFLEGLTLNIIALNTKNFKFEIFITQ